MNFNTSNVTIQQKDNHCSGRPCDNFNTSNVTIQHGKKKRDAIYPVISIHLMLLFNQRF